MVVANLFNVCYMPGTIQSEGLDLILGAIEGMALSDVSILRSLGPPVENVTRERDAPHTSAGRNFRSSFTVSFRSLDLKSN